MRRSRRHREQLSVSLFPFLAVLICTLGVLILMLVMAAKNADVEAREIREDDKEKILDKIEQLEIELNTRLVQIEGLGQVRPEVTKRLKNVRNHRGYIEREIRLLDKRAVQLAQQLMQLDLEIQKPIEALASADEIKSLEAEIELVSAELDKVRTAAAEFIPVAYSIVTQPGPNGTNRRPIYLECNEQGVVLQPSGLVLEISDFAEPIMPGNPLDAALLVIREYWNHYDLAGAAGNPYPLLVIRPSGANSYVVVRRAMTSWDDEFGYEIVEEGKTLDFGNVDQQLKAEIEAAIEIAKRRQASMLAAAIERRSRLRTSLDGNSRQRPGLVASGPQGGFVSTGGASKEASLNPQGEAAESATSSDLPTQSERPTQPMFNSVLDQYRNSNRKSAKSKLASHTKSKSQSSGNANQNGNLQGSSKLSSTPESLAVERGAGWALPSNSPGATGYLRPVRILCAGQQLGVRTATDDLVVIPMDATTEQAVEELIDVVWKLIDGWGSAGENGYWKPQLRITVHPTGRQRFEELNALLHQSGLEIKESAE